MAAAARSLVFLTRSAPHGSIRAQEALEAVLLGAAFDQRVSLLFMDDGVHQLRRAQDTAALGVKDFARAFRALADYELEHIAVSRRCLQARGLTPGDLLIAVELLDDAQLAALLDRADVVLTA